MAQFEEITITFKYIPSEQFDKWFKENVQDIMCGASVNKNKLVQSTGWYVGDAIEELQKTQEELEKYKENE